MALKKRCLRYQRLTKTAEALIAVGLSLGHQHAACEARAVLRCSRGLSAKDVVSRAWRKVKTDWRTPGAPAALLMRDIVRLILDGTVITTRLDRKAQNISVLGCHWRCVVMGRKYCFPS